MYVPSDSKLLMYSEYDIYGSTESRHHPERDIPGIRVTPLVA